MGCRNQDSAVMALEHERFCQQNPESRGNLFLHSELTFDKSVETTQWRKKSLHKKWCWRNSIHMQKEGIQGPNTYSHTQMNLG